MFVLCAPKPKLRIKAENVRWMCLSIWISGHRKTFRLVVLFRIFSHSMHWVTYCNWWKTEHFFWINCHPFQKRNYSVSKRIWRITRSNWVENFLTTFERKMKFHRFWCKKSALNEIRFVKQKLDQTLWWEKSVLRM